MDENDQLADAIQRQSLRDVRAALAAGANPNAYVEHTSMLGRFWGTFARLTEMDGDHLLGILRVLLEAGADPNQPTDRTSGDPSYLLHFASQCALVPAMRLLLRHGADPNLLVDGTCTALDWAESDAGFIQLDGLPKEYVGRLLPEYPPPSDVEFDTQGPEFYAWMMSRHQRGIELLRELGARQGCGLAMAADGSSST